jgi:hypothetical protein
MEHKHKSEIQGKNDSNMLNCMLSEMTKYVDKKSDDIKITKNRTDILDDVNSKSENNINKINNNIINMIDNNNTCMPYPPGTQLERSYSYGSNHLATMLTHIDSSKTSQSSKVDEVINKSENDINIRPLDYPFGNRILETDEHGYCYLAMMPTYIDSSGTQQFSYAPSGTSQIKKVENTEIFFTVDDNKKKKNKK